MAVHIDTLGDTPNVLSPHNLAMFGKWAETASEEELDQVMPTIFLLSHQWRSPEGDNLSHPPAPVVVRPDLGKTYTMRTVPCEDMFCQRCISGLGGYKFPWIGPWTCPSIIGDALTSPAELVRRARECGCGRH